jgi:CheY-like chemotaxis protein
MGRERAQVGRTPLRVLLVEDHEDLREGFATYLRMAAGADVATATNGLEAIDQVRLLQPDVIVMDLAMPGMDGVEAMRVLRADHRTRFIPAIAMSAHVVDQREAARARAAGLDRLCRKPCFPSDLLAAINNVLHANAFRHAG